jgi:peptidase E
VVVPPNPPIAEIQINYEEVPKMIYLSSSGKHLPDLDHAIKVYLQAKATPGGKVAIIELNDANPVKDPFADQPIYQTVEKHVKALGYSTEATAYKFFEEKKGVGTKLNDLLSKLAQPGTICIVVGGNTWQLSYAFGQMHGVRDTISRQVLRGDLMYVSFSAGSVMAGLTVEINTDDIDEVIKAGGTRTKDGFKLVQYAIRPHNEHKWSQDAGKAFERRMAAKEIKDDGGEVIPNCPVLYLKDGEAYVFAGGSNPIICHANKSAKDKIVQRMNSHIFVGPSKASWIRSPRKIAEGVSMQEIKADEVSFIHCKELDAFNFAKGHYDHLLGKVAQKNTVKQVDVYQSVPVQVAYDQCKAQFSKRGFKEEIWVFHGTPSANTVQKICTEGFKVGGQPGGPPIANGAVHGLGVYAATSPNTPMGYGKDSRSVVLCLALPGKKGENATQRKGEEDHWYPKKDWVVFKTGAQLLPKYVVHF